MLSLYKILKILFRILPISIRYPVARSLARLVYALNPRRRSVLIANLAPIVGAHRAVRVAPRLMENFAMTEVDFIFPRSAVVQDVRQENFAVFEEARRRYKKVMAVTAHLGSWELGMSYLVSRGLPMTGVYALYREEKVVRWLMSHRDPRVEWIPAARGAFTKCLEALERGRVLAMVADVPYGERGCRVRLCGAWAHLPLGPWAIASRAGAAVVPAFILRTRPGHYRMVFHEPIVPTEGPFRRQMEHMQDAYRTLLETYIRTCPEQWGLLRPFWDVE